MGDEQEFEESTAANSYHHSAHVRRYSAPWDNKKLTNNEFGSDYDQLHSSYWKNSGSRGLKQVYDENEYNDDDDGKEDREVKKDSMELNMLPMIKEDPEAERIYRLSRVNQKQQNMRERTKRSMSMSVVNVPRYLFENDDSEFPELPDL